MVIEALEHCDLDHSPFSEGVNSSHKLQWSHKKMKSAFDSNPHVVNPHRNEKKAYITKQQTALSKKHL